MSKEKVKQNEAHNQQYRQVLLNNLTKVNAPIFNHVRYS